MQKHKNGEPRDTNTNALLFIGLGILILIAGTGVIGGLLELVFGLVGGIIGLVFGLVGTVIGIVFGIIGTVIGIVFGLLGTIIGLVVSTAVFWVPILLIVVGIQAMSTSDQPKKKKNISISQ